MKLKIIRELVIIVGIPLIASFAIYFFVGKKLGVPQHFELSESEFVKINQSQRLKASTDLLPNGVNHVFFSYHFWCLLFKGDFPGAFHYKHMDKLGQFFDNAGKSRFLQITPVGWWNLTVKEKKISTVQGGTDPWDDPSKLASDYFSSRQIRVFRETFLFMLLLILVIRIGVIAITGRKLPNNRVEATRRSHALHP